MTIHLRIVLIYMSVVLVYLLPVCLLTPKPVLVWLIDYMVTLFIPSPAVCKISMTDQDAHCIDSAEVLIGSSEQRPIGFWSKIMPVLKSILILRDSSWLAIGLW